MSQLIATAVVVLAIGAAITYAICLACPGM